jgi:ribose 5-phosphate isomerase A
MSGDEQKKRAGEAAMEHVADGMTLGLGTGSTADYFVKALGAKVAAGWQVRGVPTSEKTAELAESLNIPLVSLDDVSQIDVTVDGADEIDGKLRLIKGGGGALLREKIVASASRKIITIADESKLVETLGAFALPVEIVDFAPQRALMEIARIAEQSGCAGFEVDLRDDQWGEPFVTDGGHFIADCACQAIPDPEALAGALNAHPQVIEHGLFIGLSSLAILGTDTGTRTVTAM